MPLAADGTINGYSLLEYVYRLQLSLVATRVLRLEL